MTALIAWAAGAATAVAIGLFALSSIDFGLSSHPASQPLGQVSLPDPTDTPGAIESSTATSPAATSSPEPTPSRTPNTQSGVERTITSTGGTVIARCSDNGAYLVSWSPAQGFHSEEVHRGPAPLASVKFETFGREYTTTVTCVKGVPQGKIYSDR